MDSRKAKRLNQIVTVFFFLYMLVLFRITVFRSNFRLSGLFQNGILNLTLFQGYIELLRHRDWFAFIYLFLGNIIWFIPFGMYLQYKGKIKNIWQGLFYGFLISLSIETLQYVFGTGFSELDDLALNTLGAGIGVLLTRCIQNWFLRRKGIEYF